MAVRRVAMFSMHTSPLAQPGAGDGGGMNVYVRALGASLARAGVGCDVYTRTETASQAPIVEIEPGFRVLHIDAGPRQVVAKHSLATLVDPFVAGARAVMAEQPAYDVLHANYWISGAVAHQLKHQLDVPLAATFHTLARVKAAAGIDDDPLDRVETEQQILACSDLVLASTPDEREQLATLYDFDRDRIEVVPPGVDHARFCPDGRDGAKRALGLDDDAHVLLFVGRIQRLKGADLAVSLLHALDDPRAVLLLVGGPSGADGDRELARLHEMVRELGLGSRVRFVAPQPHRRLADFYRAADVCVVPSRTESFGLVALEAAACGTPVVAAAVGGLRSLVDDGHTGFLVESRVPADWAAPVALLLDDDELRAEMGVSANARSRRYSWSVTAGRLRRLYGDLTVREPVRCS
jgi:D-inositol-3-phosphate glycosyltransferase